MEHFNIFIKIMDNDLHSDDKHFCNFLLLDNFDLRNSNIKSIYKILSFSMSKNAAFEIILATLYQLDIQKYHFPGFCPKEIVQRKKHLIIKQRLFFTEVYKECTDEELIEFSEVILGKINFSLNCSNYLEKFSNFKIFDNKFKESIEEFARTKKLPKLKCYLDDYYRDMEHDVRQSTLTNDENISRSLQRIKVKNYYDINDDRENLCLIYNNYERSGSDYDVKKLDNTFSKIKGFKVEKLEFKTKDEFMKSLSHYARTNSSRSDMIVCCILTHGNLGIFYSQEGEIIQEEDIKNIFNSNNAPTLEGKPKIFFFQACRERENNKFVDLSNIPPNGEVIAFCGVNAKKKGDYFICHSTLPEDKSIRYVGSGTWFIQTLCHQIDQYSKTESLNDICDRVNRTEPNDDNQMCEVTKATSKDIYLQKPE